MNQPALDIHSLLHKLSQKRPIFVSEADFQLELAWLIKETYPEAKVRLEYCPDFAPNIHIDILVFLDNSWIPIELKYKTKGCVKTIDGETFRLKTQGAKDVGCYLYLQDLQRIEYIRSKVTNFREGYTVLITNELNYLKPPKRSDYNYLQFSLHEGEVKTGNLDWSILSGSGTRDRYPTPLELTGSYPIIWHEYSKIDDTGSGTFMYLVNQVLCRN